MPPAPRPMLATPAATFPVDPDWTYEVKWDGYRAIAITDGKRVRLGSRNQKDLARDYPNVVAAVASLEPADVILDGEIVALDGNGRPSFQALQHRPTAGLAIVYYAFDLLSVNTRRRAVAKLANGSGIVQSEPLSGTTERIESAVRDH